MTYQIFECYKCLNCCPHEENKNMFVVMTLADIFRNVHYLDTQKNKKISLPHLIISNLAFCTSHPERSQEFHKDPFFDSLKQEYPGLDSTLFTYAYPGLYEKCPFLEKKQKRCSVHDSYQRPINCFLLPEYDIMVGGFKDQDHTESKKGKKFINCSIGKTVKEEDQKKILLLKHLSQYERGISTVVYTKHGNSPPNAIIELNEDKTSSFFTHISMQYFSNQKRREMLLEALIYSTNEFKKLIGDPDLIPKNYRDPLLDPQTMSALESNCSTSFPQEEREVIKTINKNFRPRFKKLKKASLKKLKQIEGIE